MHIHTKHAQLIDSLQTPQLEHSCAPPLLAYMYLHSSSNSLMHKGMNSKTNLEKAFYIMYNTLQIFPIASTLYKHAIWIHVIGNFLVLI